MASLFTPLARLIHVRPTTRIGAIRDHVHLEFALHLQPVARLLVGTGSRPLTGVTGVDSVLATHRLRSRQSWLVVDARAAVETGMVRRSRLESKGSKLGNYRLRS